MKRKLGERQAWLRLSDDCHRELAVNGICVLISEYRYKHRLISEKTYRSMMARMEKYARRRGLEFGRYFWPINDLESRRLFCLRQAAAIARKSKLAKSK